MRQFIYQVDVSGVRRLKGKCILKIFLTILAFLCWSATSYAQEKDQPQEYDSAFAEMQAKLIEAAKADYAEHAEYYAKIEEQAKVEAQARRERESKIQSIMLTPQVMTSKVCGMQFQSVQLRVPTEAMSAIEIRYTSANLGDKSPYSIFIPDGVVLSSDSALKLEKVSIAQMPRLSSAALLAPNFPIMGETSETPEFCKWVEGYVKTYTATTASLQSSLLRFDVVKGQVSATYVLKNAAPIQPQARQARITSIAQPNTPGLKYLIIALQEYASEANQLAQYRNSGGIQTQVQILEQLPGYDANAPTPQESSGPYEHECYFYPGQDAIKNFMGDDIMPGIEVAGLEEMVKPSTLNVPVRLTDKRGVIRAAIRKTKSDNSHSQGRHVTGRSGHVALFYV